LTETARTSGALAVRCNVRNPATRDVEAVPDAFPSGSLKTLACFFPASRGCQRDLGVAWRRNPELAPHRGDVALPEASNRRDGAARTTTGREDRGLTAAIEAPPGRSTQRLMA
jgi:hypothetical protein